MEEVWCPVFFLLKEIDTPNHTSIGCHVDREQGTSGSIVDSLIPPLNNPLNMELKQREDGRRGYMSQGWR